MSASKGNRSYRPARIASSQGWSARMSAPAGVGCTSDLIGSSGVLPSYPGWWYTIRRVDARGTHADHPTPVAGAEQVGGGIEDGLDADLADAARLDGDAARRVRERPARTARELRAHDSTAVVGAPGAEFKRVGRPVQADHRR